jgi:response regulator RpfG family c-di-GMP phosphodiesterase
MSTAVAISTPNDRHVKAIQNQLTAARLAELSPDDLAACDFDVTAIHADAVDLIEKIHQRKGASLPIPVIVAGRPIMLGLCDN